MRTLCFALAALLVMGALAGCSGMKMTNPYVSTMDRVDQNLQEGNRGFLKGTPPPAPERSMKRQFVTVDVDLPPTTREAAEAAREETSATVKKTVMVRQEEIK
jgi:hypothetical protein